MIRYVIDQLCFTKHLGPFPDFDETAIWNWPHIYWKDFCVNKAVTAILDRMEDAAHRIWYFGERGISITMDLLESSSNKSTDISELLITLANDKKYWEEHWLPLVYRIIHVIRIVKGYRKRVARDQDHIFDRFMSPTCLLEPPAVFPYKPFSTFNFDKACHLTAQELVDSSLRILNLRDSHISAVSSIPRSLWEDSQGTANRDTCNQYLTEYVTSLQLAKLELAFRVAYFDQQEWASKALLPIGYEEPRFWPHWEFNIWLLYQSQRWQYDRRIIAEYNIAQPSVIGYPPLILLNDEMNVDLVTVEILQETLEAAVVEKVDSFFYQESNPPPLLELPEPPISRLPPPPETPPIKMQPVIHELDWLNPLIADYYGELKTGNLLGPVELETARIEPEKKFSSIINNEPSDEWLNPQTWRKIFSGELSDKRRVLRRARKLAEKKNNF